MSVMDISRFVNNKREYLHFMDAIRSVVWTEGMNSLSNTITQYHEVGVIKKLWNHMEIKSAQELQQDQLRVSIDPDGRFDIVDFTTPTRSGKVLFAKAEQEQIPAWIIEAISMLRVVDGEGFVEGLGFKVSDKVYYIIDRRDDHEQN